VQILYPNVREEFKLESPGNVSHKVTRMEIAEAVSDVFGDGGALPDEIVAAANEAGRPELAAVLQNLPERRYNRLNELWEELHDIPVGV
jgi:hypothetical protein